MLTGAAHILKLEKYREDWHDPSERFTCESVYHPYFCMIVESKNYNLSCGVFNIFDFNKM